MDEKRAKEVVAFLRDAERGAWSQGARDKYRDAADGLEQFRRALAKAANLLSVHRNIGSAEPGSVIADGTDQLLAEAERLGVWPP